MRRVLDLLIVDDDPGQLQLVKIVLAELALPHRCHYAPSGPAALALLKGRDPSRGVPRPDLILLDLNMPGMDGCEVLRRLKSDPDLSSIPVVMLSTSEALEDVNACYLEHANAYIPKPKDLEGSFRLLREIDHFWSENALLPS